MAGRRRGFDGANDLRNRTIGEDNSRVADGLQTLFGFLPQTAVDKPLEVGRCFGRQLVEIDFVLEHRG